MERLQTALAKARSSRQEAATTASQGAAPPPDLPDEVAARWRAVETVALDTAGLESRRVFIRPTGALGGAFDVLRTRVQQLMLTNGWTRIAITSPSAGCGKTTIAANLAFGLARQSERRVVLLDLDLRDPSIGSTLGMRDRWQFSRTLQNQEDFAQNARRYGENLIVAGNSERVLDASDLLYASSSAEAMARISTDYQPDIVIMDLPPMMVGDDVLVLLQYVDAVIIVAAAEVTTIRQIDETEKELAQHTNVLGVVVNKCRYLQNEGGYGSYEYGQK